MAGTWTPMIIKLVYGEPGCPSSLYFADLANQQLSSSDSS